MNTQPRPPSRVGYLYALFGAIGAGAFVVPWKLASETGSVSSMVLIMLTTAASLNTVLMAHPRFRPDLRGVNWKLMGMLGAIFGVLSLTGNASSAAAITELSASVVSVLMRTEVILVAILGWLFIGERVPLPFWLGVVLAGGGIWMVQDPSVPGSGNTTLGLLYGLGAAGSFAIMGVLTRKFVDRIDLVALNATRLWISVGFWFVINGPRLPEDLSWTVIGWAALAAFIGPFLARLGLMFSARTLEARTTSMINLTGPVWSVVFAAIFLREVLTRNEIVGGLVILVGVSLPVVYSFLTARRNADVAAQRAKVESI